MEKEIQKMWHHKDVIIIVLTLLLVVVSGIAICLGINMNEGEYGGRGGDRMENGGDRKELNNQDYYNSSPSDTEYTDDSASSTNASTSAIRGMINEVK